MTLNAYAECHYAECLLCEVSQLSPLFRVSFAECQYDECLDAAETNQKCRKNELAYSGWVVIVIKVYLPVATCLSQLVKNPGLYYKHFYRLN